MQQRIRHFSIRTRALAALAVCLCLAAACGRSAKWNSDDVTGAFRPLAFTMTRTATGREVTADDFKGRIVMLYFGYTLCPDICPMTLANIAQVLKQLGADADKVSVLFVTVDPARDTPETVAAYAKQFAPQIVGLRGTPDQLAALARRYRVSYSVQPATASHPYEVSHSSAVYVFDEKGNARLVVTSLSSGTPDIKGTAADLKRLIG